jgi:sulfotransferase
MQNDIHFIWGLPRSGSTLLAGLLRRKLRLHAGMTSPAGSPISALVAKCVGIRQGVLAVLEGE